MLWKGLLRQWPVPAVVQDKPPGAKCGISDVSSRTAIAEDAIAGGARGEVPGGLLVMLAV